MWARWEETLQRRGTEENLERLEKRQPKMHPEIIILDDDTDDDEFMFEDRYTAEEKDNGCVLQWGFGGDSSRGASEEREFFAVTQAMPLRHIKQHVRCTTPSAVPEITREQQYGAMELEICVKSDEICVKNDHYQAGDVKQPNLSNSPNPKRERGDCDGWLPSDLLDASYTERWNECKRLRGNDNGEHNNHVSQTAHRIPSDVPLSPSAVAQSTESGVQVQIQNSFIDVNQVIQEMPEETAEAFKELIRLVGPFETRASRAVDEMKNGRPFTNDIQRNDPPPSRPSPPVSTSGSQEYSRAIDEMESSRSIASDLLEHTSNPPLQSATVNQVSRIVDEMENWRPLAGDVHDDPLPSQRSATTSDFEQNDSPTLSTSDFGPIDSPALATVVASYEQQNAGKRTSNADVVLYQPKQEPVESQRENNISGSVVHVKEEPDLQFEPTPDPISIGPTVGGNAAVTQLYAQRRLVITALNTFEAVRQQIIKDPSYGQPVVDPQTPSTEGNGRRLRADLKAASLMRSKGFWLNERVRPIGEVPGVAVGDCFRYRMEMAVIGLHRAVQAGIAVVPANLSPYNVSVASSVVLSVSDPYHDDNDMGDTVVYSGQGGLCGKTKEATDQELTRGNLALNNSYRFKLPVRLIRGHKEQNSMTGILYSYDGLYRIVDMQYQTGVNGKKVFKFIMHRLPGQAPIFSGYPAPLGSQSPAREPAQNAMRWTEPPDTKPLFLDKRPVA